MKNMKYLLAALTLLYFAGTGLCQSPFNNCAAAFLDQKMVVNEYSPEGHCELSIDAKGVLTVQTADLSPEGGVPTGKTSFRVAIRDGRTKTVFSFSDKAFQEIDIRKLLSKCQKGDSILLLTTNNQYALPHNEILVI